MSDVLLSWFHVKVIGGEVEVEDTFLGSFRIYSIVF